MKKSITEKWWRTEGVRVRRIEDGANGVVVLLADMRVRPDLFSVRMEYGAVYWERVSDWKPTDPEKVANQIDEWNGEGLPPIGTVCEFFVGCGVVRDSGLWKKGLTHGAKVKIINHYDTGVTKVAVFKFESPFGCMVEQAGEGCFRPIRNPEQIAAEERVEAAQAWLKGIELEYGVEIADKCESILFEAERKKTAQ